jgi:fibrillarin-like rRNA methylase
MTLVSLVNVALCIIILILGCLCYKKNQSKEVLYIGIAFGFFGISHVLSILGLAGNLEGVLIAIRMFAYLIVAFSLYQTATKH